MKLVPPIGPLRRCNSKCQRRSGEALYGQLRSLRPQYQAALEKASNKKLKLEDMNYDTGSLRTPGTYRLADDVEPMARLACEEKVCYHHARDRNGIDRLLQDPERGDRYEEHPEEWNRVLTELDDLNTARAADIAAQ